MREIGIRGWDRQEKCWIPQEQLAITAKVDILTYSYEEISWKREIIPIEISFFTGLYARNKKKIFEGDIVIQYAKESGLGIKKGAALVQGIVEYHQPMCAFGIKSGLLFRLDIDSEYEVIGNVYENPELIEAR